MEKRQFKSYLERATTRTNGFDVKNQQYYRQWGTRKLVIDTLNPRKRFGRFMLLRYIKKQPRIHRICEIGSGSGIFSNLLAKNGYYVDGYDTDSNAVALAKRSKQRNTTFKQSDIYDIPDKQIYDLIISNSVLEHIKDDNKAVKKMASLIRPGGTCIIAVPANMKYMTEEDKRWGHYRRYTKKSLSEKMSKAGLIPIQSRYYAYPLLKWFYFTFYLRASKKRENIIRKKHIPLYYYILNLIWPIFLIDLLWDSPRATNVLVIARKPDKKRQIRKQR